MTAENRLSLHVWINVVNMIDSWILIAGAWVSLKSALTVANGAKTSGNPDTNTGIETVPGYTKVKTP